jgi:hypothetical protein
MAARTASSHDAADRTKTNADNALANDPTPDYDVPGMVDISGLRPGDMVEMEGHAMPLEVVDIGVRTQKCVDDTPAKQYAVALEHDREDAITHEIVQVINLIDGEPVELVDLDDGTPVRLFKTE